MKLAGRRGAGGAGGAGRRRPTGRRWSPTMPTSRRRATPTRSPTAQRLGAAVDALIAEPSAEALQAARAAWLAARVPYQQTEVFRFGNAIVDEWEGKVNAWPLDEGLIDYVDASYGGATDENPYAALNVIANPSFTLSGGTVDASDDHAGAARRHAAGGGRDRGERRDRLSRHRVPALGAGPERHRAGRRQPALDRLCGGRRLHRRQLRPAGGLPEGGDRPADLRSRVDGGAVGRGRRRRARACHRRPGRRDRRDPDRHGQPVATASRPASGCGSG